MSGLREFLTANAHLITTGTAQKLAEELGEDIDLTSI